MVEEHDGLKYIFFFFKQKTAYEIKECDWSSDVCSSDLCTIARGVATITIRDWGHTFNPLELPPPDLNLDINERPIGGLGIYLMKKFTDRLEYRREDDSNILTIIKNLN